MANYKNKKALVIDTGLFMHLAVTLGESFGEVYYWSPWLTKSPKTEDTLVGKGLPGVTRVSDISDVEDDVDLFVFPDLGFGSLQLRLEKQGKRVWGARRGDVLEMDRVQSKTLCAERGIGIGPYKVVTGISALRECLQMNDNVFVKVSTYRGDFETFRSETYQLIEPQIDRLEWALGPKKNSLTFVIERAIDDAVEAGWDGFTIDGKFPEMSSYGIELKGLCYLGEYCPTRQVPRTLIDINERLSPLLRSYGYRGFFSDEVRIVSREEAYLIDPCCRMPFPPGELYCANTKNIADIIWEGAGGVMVTPQHVNRFGVQLRIMSDWAADNWQPVYFPHGIADFVKLRNCTRIDGQWYCLPGLTGIGGIVATDDTIDGAIKKARQRAELVSGYGIETDWTSLEKAASEFRRLQAIDGTLKAA